MKFYLTTIRWLVNVSLYELIVHQLLYLTLSAPDCLKQTLPCSKSGVSIFHVKKVWIILITKRQTTLIKGETARYELTHLNLYCLQKPQLCLWAILFSLCRIHVYALLSTLFNKCFFSIFRDNLYYELNVFKVVCCIYAAYMLYIGKGLMVYCIKFAVIIVSKRKVDVGVYLSIQ